MSKVYYPLVNIEDVISILSKIAIFGGFTEVQLYEIFKLLKVASYAEGEYIYKRGDEPRYIYIIQRGEVKISLDSKGVSFELISLSVGNSFGETSVIGIQSHSASALAVAATDLIVLERSALLNIFETDKELFGMLILNIARETARRLQKTDEMLIDYILKNK